MSPTGVDIGTAFPIAQNFPSLASLISSFLPKALLLGGLIFFVLTVGAGIAVIASSGSSDPHSQEQAKNFLTYSVIGLIIIFGAYWVLQIINFITKGTLSNILGP